jgi:hypothetical protein
MTADEFNDPVSYKFDMRTPIGLISQELSVDIRYNVQNDVTIPRLGVELWRGVIATAINRDCSLDLVWYVRWRSAPLALPHAPPLFTHGDQVGATAPRHRTVVTVMHTGHSDNYASRRLYLPSTPANWQSAGLLNARGWDSLMVWAHGVKMGLAGLEIGGDLGHIIAYPFIIDPEPGNLGGVLFRKVTHLKVMQFTDKAPEWTGNIWP